MCNGVENLLDSVGVETRASSKKYLPRFFHVIYQMTTHHGHPARPTYRTPHQSRLRRKRDDRIGVC